MKIIRDFQSDPRPPRAPERPAPSGSPRAVPVAADRVADSVRAAARLAEASRASGVESEIPVRRDLLPGTPAMPDKSDIPGYTHLQCGEFAYKYFKAQDKPYPTLGQPYNFLMTGEPYPANLPTKDYQRVLNGGTTPPKAGDILVAKGPGGGEFHTAIVTKVEAGQIHLIQANVPYGTQAMVEATLPLETTNGKYHVQPFPTSQLGYRHDFAVVGWIHPSGNSALPGAPA